MLIFIPGLNLFFSSIKLLCFKFKGDYNLNIYFLPLLILSLAGGLFFLFFDKETKIEKEQFIYGLQYFAAVLIILVIIGLYTGELGNPAPFGN